MRSRSSARREAGIHDGAPQRIGPGRRVVRRVHRHHDPHPVRLRRGGPGGRRRRPHGSRGRPREPRQHRLGLGPGSDPGRLRRGEAERCSPQSGGERRAGRLQGFPVEEGRPLRAGPGGRRLRGGADRPLELHRSAGRGRPRPHHQDAGRLLHAPGQREHEPAGDRVGRTARPDHRHRHPAPADLRRHGPAGHAARSQPRPVHRRPDRRGDRHGVGHQRRLRDQPGP